MGSPVSPIIANLYMEEVEAKAIRTALKSPSVWLRYVDDTFVKIHEYFVNDFTEHLNSIDENIKFTTEPEMEGKLPFLDSCTTLNDDGSLDLTVYRKPTHTDQYLNFNSNHHLQHKRSVVRTLINRANCMVTKPEQKDAEVRHVKSALKANGYKEWASKIPQPKNKSDISRNTTGGQARTSVGLPYIRGTSEKLARIFRNHGVRAYHKPFNTLHSILVHPKDKTPDLKKCGVVYEIQCPECPAQYVGETARTLETRMRDHLKQKSPRTAVGEHEHSIKMDDVKVIAREDNMWRRKIRESIEIRTHHPAINRDQGYELPPIYDELLSCDLGGLA